jgi:HK97 family phage portal protein
MGRFRNWLSSPAHVTLPGGDARSTLENPSVDLVRALTLEDSLGSYAGPSVTPWKALQVSAVYACQRVLAESVGALPLPVYRTRDERSHERDNTDPRYRMLNVTPNPEMTGIEFWEALVGYANGWGYGAAYIRENRAGMVAEMWPLPPDRTKPFRLENGRLAWAVTLENGQVQTLPDEQVLAIRAYLGKSPVMCGKEDVGLALAAQEYGARVFVNDGRPGGLIETAAEMDTGEMLAFRRAWEAGHRGLSKSHLVGILTNGAQWKEVGIAPEALQYLDTRRFSVQEVARRFRVPVSLIEGDKGSSLTYATTESDSIHFVTHSLRPWLVRIEQALDRRVFVRQADLAEGRYAQFNVDALLRSDTLTRYRAHAIAIKSRFKTRAEVRELEDLPFIEGTDEFDEPAGAGAGPEDLGSADDPTK